SLKNVMRRTIRRNKLGSSIHSAIRPLVKFIAFLLWSSASSGLGTPEIRRDHGRSATPPMVSPNCGLINTPNLNFYLSLSKTQVQQFKKDVSNSATQDSIMNAHKKTQLTHAKINCALKDSGYDSPFSKNLKLTILASNASSSSTKVLKFPHTKNDSIFTHIGSQFKAPKSMQCSHSQK
ncbi:hypothetical protein H5410_046118, partial [Solanum commersonii]